MGFVLKVGELSAVGGWGSKDQADMGQKKNYTHLAEDPGLAGMRAEQEKRVWEEGGGGRGEGDRGKHVIQKILHISCRWP